MTQEGSVSDAPDSAQAPKNDDAGTRGQELGNPGKADDFLELFRSIQTSASNVLLLLFLTLAVSWYVGIEEYKGDYRELTTVEKNLKNRINSAYLFGAIDMPSNLTNAGRPNSGIELQDFAADTGCSLDHLNKLFMTHLGRVPTTVSNDPRHAIEAADICDEMKALELNQEELDKRKIEFSLLGTTLTASIWVSFAIWSGIFCWFCMYLLYKRVQLYGLLAKSLAKLRMAHGDDRRYMDLIGAPAFWLAPTTTAPLCGIKRDDARLALGWTRAREYIPFSLILLPVTGLVLMSLSVIAPYIENSPGFGVRDLDKRSISFVLTLWFSGAGILALAAAFLPTFSKGGIGRGAARHPGDPSPALARRLFLVLGGGTIGALFGAMVVGRPLWMPFGPPAASPEQSERLERLGTSRLPRYREPVVRHRDARGELAPGFYKNASSDKIHYVSRAGVLLGGAQQKLADLELLAVSPLERFVAAEYNEIPPMVIEADGAGRADLLRIHDLALSLAAEEEALTLAKRGESPSACKLLLAIVAFDLTSKRVVPLNLRLYDLLAGLAVRYGQEEALTESRKILDNSHRSNEPQLRERLKKWENQHRPWRAHWAHSSMRYPDDRLAWKQPLFCPFDQCDKTSAVTYLPARHGG